MTRADHPGEERVVPESLPARFLRRTRWAVRDRVPNRWVVRSVRGVPMAMPWSHRLPDYTRVDPAYAQNLVDLAESLAAGGRLNILDVGANIGDSILLMLDRVDADVLAVEPDDIFLPFLRHNVGDDHRVTIEPSLLRVGDEVPTVGVSRVGGTAAYVSAEGSTELAWISVETLRRRHAQFDRLRLVKSDTDGHDVVLVPEIARVWNDSRPVLFFEYDDRASLDADHNPLAMWDDLMDLGYELGAVWDNGGHPLEFATLAELRKRAARERPSSPGLFWDVAVAHRDDGEAEQVLRDLIDGDLGQRSSTTSML